MKLNVSIPTSWNELTDNQLIKVAKTLTKNKSGKMQVYNILRILMNCRWYTFKTNSKLVLLMLNVPLSELQKHFSFIYDRIDRTKPIKNQKIKNIVYYAPMDRLINLNANEFAAADDLHNKYLETQNIEYLQYLMAVLYKPKNSQPFDKINLHQLAEPFKKINPYKLIATHFFFSGCKHIIVKRFPKAFPKSAKKTKEKYGFGKVILNMAKGDLSKHNAIKNVNIYTFLEQFQEDIINSKPK